ncbi:MAG: TonB-dependent receptor [Salinivirgaceae bacterium]
MRTFKYYILFGILNFLVFAVNAQKKTDAHIIGHVTANGQHLPFASIVLKGTTIGTSADETGHFSMLNLPLGSYTVRAQVLGYKSEEKEVELVEGKTAEIKFELVEDLIGLEQVVVTANRNEQNRKDAMTLVNSLTPKLFLNTNSVNLGEGLNFTPGLRLENNCQNCGFTQVRMNGMEGPYSQVLINSRAIFSGLAGVYGLELFPANMIERVEVVRGGGSALYGSNAIAGTINLITKDPINSAFEVNTGLSLIGVGHETSGGIVPDRNINFNASVVDAEAKAGVSVFGFYRQMDPFDANNDGFSEIAQINNTTVGTRAYHRTGKRGKITFDYFNINEKRRGGDRFAYSLHEANIAEAVTHNINTGALSYDQLFNHADKLSVFASVQNVARDSYYGAGMDPSAYGATSDLSYALGAQFSLEREKLGFAPGNLVMGLENNGGYLNDKKLGYFDWENNIHTPNTLVADQSSQNVAAFVQSEWEFGSFKSSLGLRVDHYVIDDKTNATLPVEGTVLSPRISLKYEISTNLMSRLSYSHGFRAPQIFDEDLHIEVSSARKVVHVNDPGLKQEESRSIMASLDMNHTWGTFQNQGLIEGFYTRLNNPFVNDYGTPDADGTVVYTRVNANDGAFVAGVNLEWNLAPSPVFMAKVGFTAQISEYDKPQELDEKRFVRTPNTYGFVTIDYDVVKNLCLMVSGNYTGSMLVPYFGTELPTGVDGIMKKSDPFFDLGLKVAYDIKLNGTILQLSTGVKNLFNSYQSDFDSGEFRDPGYMYGPGTPRVIYFGLRFSNIK